MPLTAYPVQGGVPPYDLLPKMKIELVVRDDDVEKVIDAIMVGALC